MPTWNQIQSQLRHTNNPVVFIDVAVGTTVGFDPIISEEIVFNALSLNTGNRSNDF